jgi:hypothetical protein
LGQIKHVTDNGLDKRSGKLLRFPLFNLVSHTHTHSHTTTTTAAYEVLYVLLDTAFDAISVGDYTDPILRGMTDVMQVREQAYKVLRRLAQVAGGQVFVHLDALLPQLEKEIKSPIPKADPFDRMIVMKRAAFQAALALNAIPNSNIKLQTIAGLKFEKLDAALKSAYEEELGRAK